MRPPPRRLGTARPGLRHRGRPRPSARPAGRPACTLPFDCAGWITGMLLVGWRHGGLRRVPPGVLRRPGGPGRCDAVPAERDPGPGHPPGAAGGGGRALLRGRRGQPDQPAVPGPDRRDRQGFRRCRGGPADLLGEPELGSLPDGDRRRDGRRRGPAGAGLRHLGLRVLLQLPAVPGRHRAGAGRGRARRHPRSTRSGTSPPSGVHRAVRRRDRGGHRVAASPGSARASRSCSPRTACRTPWPRPAGRRRAAATRPAGRGVGTHRRSRAQDSRHRPGGHPWRLVYQSRSGPPGAALARPGRLRLPGGPGPGRGAGRGPGPGRLHHRPHGGRPRPGHRGGRDRPAARAAAGPRGHPQYGSALHLDDHRAGHRTAGGRVSPGGAGLPGLRHRRLLPPGAPARPGRPAAASWAARHERAAAAGPGGPADPGPVGGQRGGGDAGRPAPGRPSGPPGGRGHQVQPDRRGHRDGPRSRGDDRGPDPGRAASATPSSARKAANPGTAGSAGSSIRWTAPSTTSTAWRTGR